MANIVQQISVKKEKWGKRWVTENSVRPKFTSPEEISGIKNWLHSGNTEHADELHEEKRKVSDGLGIWRGLWRKPLSDLQSQLEKDTRGYKDTVEILMEYISAQEFYRYSSSSESEKKPTVENTSKGTGRYGSDLSPDKLLWEAQPLEVKASWQNSEAGSGQDNLNPFYTKEIHFKVDNSWSQELENEFKERM